MVRKQPQNVIVHNDREDEQQEDHADGDETLLHAHAEVAADQSLNRQEQDVPSIERRNREKVQYG